VLRRLQGCAEPPAWTAALREQQRAIAIWELRHQHVVMRAIDALARAGVEPILLKGTALAYWLYDDPSLRPRGDTDILVREDARRTAEAELAAAGFVRRFGIEGEIVSSQATYTWHAVDGTFHAIDLHWRANNSPVLARLFPHSELARASQPVPALGCAARRTGVEHALLLACVHRAVHEANPYYVGGRAVAGLSRLIWLYDLHLLGNALGRDDWGTVVTMCNTKGLSRITGEALSDAAHRLGTSVPPQVVQSLANAARREPAHSYVRANKRVQRWLDLFALGWRDRLRLVRETGFPPASYMRTRYAPKRSWLPWLYIRRLATGWRRDA
jgi:hypothetical protein